ncbi:Retrovirus-related Pol polyprotein from transposon 17.6 [Nosema granulosis]|uniref:Retrovirus-related Pol polyprotein from transposon 17.6 n=1 Tax=Nosema granulosis TaxID=83296 RepID=A0A9P6H0J3_9MICR|nr:Retrovirus-related Pol polyprotein from transposon 17.6 [Nosema granulosis]
MKKLKVPDDKKTFRVRTDSCDSEIGAILLQKDNEGGLVPIQWASKMLTPTERRYTISEKEMLAVLFGIKKFESDLRGRKFHLMTDHKALAKIRNKPYFNNNRIDRWIEQIQEFDFTIEYIKGEVMTDADALSRQYKSVEIFDEMNTNEQKKKDLVKKQMLEKEKKHVIEKDGRKYLEVSTGEVKEILNQDKRENETKKVHEGLNHRGVKGTYYNIKQKWYWPGMKD